MSEAAGVTTKQEAAIATKPAAELPVHARPIDEILDHIGSSTSDGLSDAEARTRLDRDGPNKLPEGKKKSAILRLLEQFINPLVLTLLAAAVIAVVVGVTSGQHESFLARFGGAIAILLIVIINA